MATSGVERELYSFSTEDGKAIPLDIIRPLSLIVRDFVFNAPTSVTLPASWKVASFFSASGCYIEFASETIPYPLVAGTEYNNVLFVPPGVVTVSTVLPGVCRVLAYKDAGSLVIQQIQKWAGLALRRQATSV